MANEIINQSKTKNGLFEKRIHEIDLARGILMCLVIMDHLFNLLFSYGKTWSSVYPDSGFLKGLVDVFHFYFDFPYTGGVTLREIVQWICLASFCFVSGISSAFSKNNWKRASEMLVLWLIIFCGSNVLQILYANSGMDLGIISTRVDFNIIGVLAFSTLIYCFFQEKNWKTLMIVGLVCLAIHPCLILASNTDLGKQMYVPILWDPSNIAYQADYMPLFPYIAFFFFGAMLSSLTYSVNRKSYFKRHEWERPICFLGRHSLIVYISHFAIMIGIFALLDLVI